MRGDGETGCHAGSCCTGGWRRETGGVGAESIALVARRDVSAPTLGARGTSATQLAEAVGLRAGVCCFDEAWREREPAGAE